MEKNLVAIGNSVGVVIDRGLCRMLEVKRGSRVRISSDGERLLIEPIREQKKVARLELMDAARIIETLVAWGIPAEVIHRLNPRLEVRRAHVQAVIWARGLGGQVEPEDEVHARRFLTIYKEFKGGAKWEAAAETALSCA